MPNAGRTASLRKFPLLGQNLMFCPHFLDQDKINTYWPLIGSRSNQVLKSPRGYHSQAGSFYNTNFLIFSLCASSPQKLVSRDHIRACNFYFK